MSKVIDATLRLIDNFTKPMQACAQSLSTNSRKMKRAGKDIEKTGRNISRVGSSLTTKITLPIGAVGIASFKMASDLNESVNKVDVAFGKSSGSIKKWSDKTLKQFGIAKGTSLDMAAQFGDMGTSMGLTQKAAAKMSKELVGRAGDLSSFKNISIDVAKTALNGVFTGETESLKGLGVVMTQANLENYAHTLGIKKKIKAMSQQEQTLLRYKYVMKATKNAQGDFSRTNDQAANQTRMFTEGLKQLGASIGKELLPYGTKLIKFANGLVTKFSHMSKAQKDMVIKIALMAAAAGPAIKIFGGLTGGVGKTISTLGNAGASIKGVLPMFGKMGKSVAGASGIFGKLAAGGGGIGKILVSLLGPGKIVALVLAGVAVAGVLIYKNWGKIQVEGKKLVSWFKKTANNAGINSAYIKKNFSSMQKNVVSGIKTIIKAMKPVIKALMPVIKVVGVIFVKAVGVAFKIVSKYVLVYARSLTQTIKGITRTFKGLCEFISGIFTGNWGKAWKGVKDIFKGVFDSFVGIAKMPLNIVISLVNKAIDGLNKFQFKIPKGIPKIGGKKFGLSIGHIPMLYKGTNNWRGGITSVNERGGEIIDLPRGSRVYPHDKSVQMARNEGKKIHFNIAKFADQIIIREDADIDKIVDRLARKLELVAGNM